MYLRTAMLPVLSMLACPYAVLAERWEAPDGFLSVEIPDKGSYAPSKPISPPQLVRWESPSGSMEFAVELVPHPPQFKPTFEQMERAYGSKDTTVDRLPIRKIGKHEVWTIATSNDDVKQLVAIVHHDKWFHRIRVSGLASSFDMDSAKALVKSIKINAGEWEPPTATQNECKE